MSRIDVAVAFYALIYPICFFFTANVFPAYERFGLRWQALCVSALLSFSTLILERKSAGRYWDWLKQSPFSLVLPAGFLWLFVLGVVHGFTGDQMDGLVSGCFALIMMPLGFYCWPQTSTKIFARATFLVLSFGLVVENILLSIYAYKGISPNLNILFAQDSPRLFLNIRDGNTLAIAVSVLALQSFVQPLEFSFGLSSRPCFLKLGSWSLGCFLLSSVFYNGFLTQGRGVFFSIFGGLLALLFCALIPVVKWFKTALSIFLSSAIGWCSWALFSLALAARENSIDLGLGNMVARESGGRFELWSGWWNSFVSQSIWFGHGLGIHPADYLVDAVAKNRTPHNLGLQILTDSGLWGCLFAVFLSVIIFVKLRNLSLSVRPVCLYALVSLGLYSMVASTIFWPTGVWICSLFPALLPHERMLPGSESVRSSVASARIWLLMVMILALVCYLQVVLVSGKQVLMIPAQWLLAS